MKTNIFHPLSSERGATLLLVGVIVSAIFAISIGIFNVVFGEFRISGEINDSFIAFYATEQGIEKTLYRDRVQGALCPTPGPNCYTEGPTSVESGGCFDLRVSKNGTTNIISSGQYHCGVAPSRVVKRGFSVTY